MKMRQCIVVACDQFHATEHPHFLRLIFVTEAHGALKFNNPSEEVIRMMLRHSKTVIVYEECDGT